MVLDLTAFVASEIAKYQQRRWSSEDERLHPRAGKGEHGGEFVKRGMGSGSLAQSLAKLSPETKGLASAAAKKHAETKKEPWESSTFEARQKALSLKLPIQGKSLEELVEDIRGHLKAAEPQPDTKSVVSPQKDLSQQIKDVFPDMLAETSSKKTSDVVHSSQPEANDHARSEIKPDDQLLEADRQSNRDTAKPRVDGVASPEPANVPTGEAGGTVGERRSGSVPDGHDELGGRVASADAGSGNGPGDREGTGVATTSPTEPDGRGSSGPVGGGGSVGGHGSGGERSVREVLTERPSAENPTDVSAGNWRYHSRDFFQGGIKAKFANNLEAIKTMRLIQEEGRDTATPAEQETLSKFVGWGAMPGLFNEYWDYKNTGGQSFEQFRDERDKWNDERKLLKPLMSDADWDAARKATLNSHFTHPSVVDAHWKMAQKLGFKGGRFLEPSAGIGYYLGLMPPELAGKTRSTAVELDSTTGNMLKLMYPKANVQVQGFQDQQSPDDFFDLVASNVPFGSYGVHDPRYNKHQANIHDYFFLKSADVAKPGGLVMHVTSTGTMDKPDDKVRQELAKSCDFVAAVRFPGGTHQSNAGTEVVTDMIILRKRHPGEQPVTLDHTPYDAEPKEPGFTGTTTDSLGRVYHWVDGKRVPGPDWMGVKQVPDPAGGEPITINSYFADHPEQILGTLDRTGTMYRGESVNVSKTDDYEQRLQAAIDRLPEGVFAISAANKGPERIEATAGVKDGGYVIHDGKLFRREGGSEVAQHPSAKDLERIRGQLEIRDAKQAVVDAELAGEPSDEARKTLNAVYDAYVAKYGPLSNRDNVKVMKGDPDAPNLQALEKWNPTAKTAKKADIFTKETIRAHSRATKADNVGEGLGVSLNETGGVDPARIAELTGKSQSEIEKDLVSSGLAFEDPSDGWQPADQYLAGNVRQKLMLARAAAAADPKYQPNVNALEKVQPEDVDYQDIDVRLGAGWVPASDVKEFARNLGGISDKGFTVNYVPATGEWQFRFDGKWAGNLSEYQTERKSFTQIMDAVLNNRSLAVYDTDSDGNRHYNDAETKAAEAKAQDVKDKFGEWIWEDDERRQRLHRLYNDNFNNIVRMKYNGSHLDFPGMTADFKMRDIQKNFVWQVISTGRGLAAHEVGTGKTASMIASAMELRRLGLAKKPMIAVKKANIEQITKEALELYPGAKILSTADKFDAANRKRTIAQMATGDYDMVIMTHDQMDLLGMRPETQQTYINEELAELEAAKAAAWADDPKKTNRVVKALEAAKAKLESRLREVIDSAGKDDAVHFEETGIDQIFVDEAHRYKSLPVYTHGERVKGVPQTRSDRATNMLMRARWLQEHNGGRGVVFATGTPVANTMAELYNIQRYLQPNELKERGITSFDAWASAFGDRQTEMEPTVTGSYEPVTRFSKFTNIPELMQIAGLVMDVERADDLKNPDGSPVVVRPQRHDKVITTPENDQTKRMMADLQARAQTLKHARPEKGADNMAVVCSDGRKGSVDARMLYADAPDDPTSKLNQCVDNVLKLSRERPGTTQLIFSNVGVNPSPQTGFHLYGDIINKLVAGGIPREKIADFSKLEGTAKDAAQEAMRRGDVIVGIGSTEKLGTGVNVQQRVAAMHHLDVPWQPAEIEQRDGRGYRCGNRNDPTKPANEQNVDIYRYVSEGSLDQFMWNLVGKKAHFINQVIGGKGKARSVSDEDTETLSPEQLMAIASGDPRVLQKVQLEADLRELKMAEKRHSGDESKRKDKIKELTDETIPAAEEKASRSAQDAKHVTSLADNNDDFTMKVGDTVHSDRKAAGEAFQKLHDEQSQMYQYSRDEGPIAEYKGFKVHVPAEYRPTHVELEGPSGERYTARPSIASIDAVLRSIPKVAAEHAEAAKNLKTDLATHQAHLGKGFKRADEYATKQQQLKDLEAELSHKNHPVEPAKKEEDADMTTKANYSRLAAAIAREMNAAVIPAIARYSQGQARKAMFSRDALVADLAQLADRVARYQWQESKHPRGQPENKGEFAKTPGGGSSKPSNTYGTKAPEPEMTKAPSPHAEMMASRMVAARNGIPQKPLTKEQAAPNATVPPALAPVAQEPTTAPPPGKVYNPNPGKGKDARVGVPGMNVPPPPAMVPRLPNLNPQERAVEHSFATMFEHDPDGTADRAIQAMANGMGDGPNIFATDEMKGLFDQWKGTKVTGPDGKSDLSPETKAFRSQYNTALHQTANAIAKRAFVRYLDSVVSKLPPEKKHVLVTAGGVAAGKGYAIANVDKVNKISQLAAATWDSAGEQNSTELPWLAQECKKRGIKMTAVFVHANPSETWENPARGVMERAAKKGRMVDARVFADSYTHGARNFADFQKNTANDPDVETVVLDNTQKTPQTLPGVPQDMLSMKPDQLYLRCLKALAAAPVPQPVKEGGAAGVRIWGPPKASAHAV